MEYEFFDFEEPAAEAAELGRQLRLHLADRPLVFVSWVWTRGHEADGPPYEMAFGPQSFFLDEPAAVVDVSNTARWRPLVGRAVTIGYRPAATGTCRHQVVEICGGGRCVCASSLGVDVVRLSDAPPF